MIKPCGRRSRGIRKKWEISVVLMGLALGFTMQTGCKGLSGASSSVSEPLPSRQLNESINHIVFMLQENRGFDHYFGKLPDYWKANGYPDQAFDGLPANASNPADDGSTVNVFHLRTVCVQNLSPGWNESHVDWNVKDPTGPWAGDGFVHTAAHFSQTVGPPDAPIFDQHGLRTMGYYDGNDLNFYYFMASNFATSDRWFAPVMSRTQLNRLYLFAATSAGYVNPPKVTLPNKTIFELLEAAGVSWKIYETDPGTAFIGNFQPFASQHTANIRPLSEYFSDVANGTLPAVALVEPGYKSGLDEHPGKNIQTGAAHVNDIIKALMQSPSWKDSVFILTFDEFGSFYDHVPPQPATHPGDTAPIDIGPNDVCSKTTGPNCDFNFTGFRIPLLVVSPFTKKNYVSHRTADFTAILKLIETRFGLPSLTKRDAAQMDMTEFFDFTNPPWTTPPNPPDQRLDGLCDFKAIP